MTDRPGSPVSQTPGPVGPPPAPDAPDVFLSYSRKDQPVARRFAESLEREGFTVWWDQSLGAGEHYDRVTERALREARAVVVLWSKESVESRWVRAEATIGDRNGTLVPAMIDDCTRPVMFELTQTADLSHWSGDPADPAWRHFLASVRRFVGKRRPADQVSPAAGSPLRAGLHPRNRVTIALAAIGLALIAAAAWHFMRTGQTPSASAASGTPVSLAVLPFADLSEARDQEYFSDGLTEEILNQLAQVKALRVAGRTSSFSFKGKNEDLRDIAAKLGVGNLLEGSVRRDGDRMRITAQLIDGRDGTHRWSKTYERARSDVFDLQDEVARDVAQALSVTLDVGEITRAEGGTTDPEAYDRYLQARALLLQDTDAGARQALASGREAVRRDPAFSRGWMMLAYALMRSGSVAPPEEAAVLWKELAEAIEKTRTLTPDAWWVRLQQVGPLMGQKKWQEALTLARSVMDEAPLTGADLERSQAYYDVLVVTGRLREAVRVAQIQTQVEPRSLLASTTLQMTLDAVGEPELAAKEYERSLEFDGPHDRVEFQHLVRLLRRAPGDAAELQSQFGRLSLGSDFGFISDLSRVHADPAAASALLAAALRESGNGNLPRLQVIAVLGDAIGDRELAMAALGRMLDTGGGWGTIWVLPRSGVRADPRFKDIVRGLGLVDYWRQSGNWADFCKPVGADDFECS